MNTVRKSISLTEEEAQTISRYAHSVNKSFSEFVRETVLSQIEADKKLSLKEYLNKYCDFVSAEEQADYDIMKLDKSEDGAVSISIEEILRLANE